MKKNSNVIFLSGILVAAIFAGIGSYSFANYTREKEETNIEEDFVQESTNEQSAQTALATTQNSVEVNKIDKSEASAPVIPVDFDKLQKTNPDIFAWINVPGTKIDYPIAQHPTDDGYYLKHGANGMSSSHGCPYIELCDTGSFKEFNTVVYGHNMKDGSMFAGLHNFEDKDFFNKHREVKVYTKEHAFTYKIFGAVMYSDAHIPYYYNDNIESDRTAFIKSLTTDSVADRSYIDKDVKVTKDNYILTLSTCDAKLRSNRYIVLAVLTEIDGQSAGK